MVCLRYTLISLCLFGVIGSSAQQVNGVVIDKIVAKVDDYIILKSEHERSYLEYLSAGNPRSEGAKCGVLENLVVQKMLVAKAEIDSIVVSDVEVLAQLDSRINAVVQQYGSQEELEKVFGKPLSQIRDDLFDQIKEQLLATRVQQEITQGVKVTPSEVRRFFSKIPSDSLPYFSTEVTVAQVVMVPEPSKEQREKVRRQLLDIKGQLLQGASFGALAGRYSEDPGSRSRGGELPLFSRGDVAPEFEAAAMTMEIGQVSEPVESKFGFHLIELQDRKGATFKTRHILIKPKPAEQDRIETRNFLDSLRTVIQADSISFSKVANEHSEDQMTSSNGGFFVDGGTGSMQVPVEALDPGVFFAVDTMEIGSISRPISFQQPDGTQAYRILYYKARIPPHLANLKDDYQKLAAATLNNKRNQLLNDWFLNARDEVFVDIDEDYLDCRLFER